MPQVRAPWKISSRADREDAAPPYVRAYWTRDEPGVGDDAIEVATVHRGLTDHPDVHAAWLQLLKALNVASAALAGIEVTEVLVEDPKDGRS